MELTTADLATSLRVFSEYLQRTGGRLFTEAFRIHQIRTLSVQQLRYLEVIEGNPGVKPADLATVFGVARPTVSNIIAQLESRGLVHSEPDPDDRRVKRLGPTAVTSRIFEQRRGMYVELARHIETKLTGSEIRRLADLLSKAADGLENGDE